MNHSTDMNEVSDPPANTTEESEAVTEGTDTDEAPKTDSDQA